VRLLLSALKAGYGDRLLHGARRRHVVQQSIDISCHYGAEQQTHRPLLLLSIDGTDRQMDERLCTDYSSYNSK